MMSRSGNELAVICRRAIARLLLALNLALFLALSLAAAPAVAQSASDANLEQLRQRALDLVNRARKVEGLPALTLSAQASAAAQYHAEDMLARGYYAHASPTGESVRDRYQKAGGHASRLTAENIARCTTCAPPPLTASVDSLHEGWLQSPAHRTNILRQGLREFGFGIFATANGGLYAVQVFTGPGVPNDLRQGEATTTLNAEAQLAALLGQINQARQKAGVAPIEASSGLSTAARALLPVPITKGFELSDGRRIQGAVPEAERPQWRSLGAIGVVCNGCGEAPTEADIRGFAQYWLRDRHSATLLGTAITHLGFAMATDGEGRKLGVTVLGTRR